MRQRILSRIATLNPHLQEVLPRVALAFILRIMGAGLAFGLNVAIGRLLGAEGTGLYFLALSVVMIGAVVTKLGLDNTLLRFIASAASQNDANALKGVFNLGMLFAGLVSFAATLGVFAFAPWIATYIFRTPELSDTLRVMSLGLFTFSMMTLLAECLKGLKRVRNSMLVSGVLFPLVALSVLWPLTSMFGTLGAAMAYTFGTAVSALVGALMWRRNSRQFVATAPNFDRQTLWQSSRPLWVMSIINRGFLPWAPLFLLGIWGSTEDAGVFGAATRIAMLITFFLTAVNTVIAPKFAELHAKGDIEMLGHLARRFALLTTVAASPLLLLLILAGDWVMSMFGPEFTRGGTALAILAVGQAVNTMTGSVGILLIMTGNEKCIRDSTIIGLIVLFLASYALILPFGLIGAALSSALSIICINIYGSILIYKKFGFVIIGIKK